jgi:hypothetical protein
MLYFRGMLNAYRPCLPTRVMKAPTGERWVHEIKHDGFRIVAGRIGRDVRLFTKQGGDYTARYPLVVEAIARLRVSSMVLDGEAVCIQPDGSHDFQALWDRTNDAGVWLCAFDPLELNGEDLLAKDRPGLQFVEYVDGDGPNGLRPRLQARTRRYRVDADRPAIRVGSFEELAEDQEQGASCHAAGPGGVRAGTARPGTINRPAC